MDFHEKVAERLKSAREDEARLVRELEAVRYLITSDEKALSIYAGGSQESTNGHSASAPTPKVPKARQQNTKAGAILAALKKFGQEGATVLEAYEEAHRKNTAVDRDYAGKVLHRLKKEGKAGYNNGKYTLIG